MTLEIPTASPQRVLLVTGPAGAGRSTALHALEDIGYEAIDNLPLSLIPRLLDGPPHGPSLALGVDPRTRDFSAGALADLVATLQADPRQHSEMLFLDCRPDVLMRRFSETRRRHPLAPAESPDAGIARELDLLMPIRGQADFLIDTSDLTQHDLRAELSRLFGGEDGQRLAISVQSFSYKRGIPRAADMVFDCRFLQNPYWQPELRAFDGLSPQVTDYVAADPRFDGFFSKVRDLTEFLLPAYVNEGKSHLSIAFGCTGGQHRSVTLAEKLSQTLAESGWRVSKRHREIERKTLGQAKGETENTG